MRFNTLTSHGFSFEWLVGEGPGLIDRALFASRFICRRYEVALKSQHLPIPKSLHFRGSGEQFIERTDVGDAPLF